MFGNLKKKGVSRAFFVFLFYAIVLFVSPFINISTYNSIVVVFFSIILFFLFIDEKNIRIAISLFCLLFPILLFNPSSYLYFIYDYLNILLILLILDISQRKAYLKQNECRIIVRFFLLYVVLFLILIEKSSFYNEYGRYSGLMNGSNLSSVVIISILIYIIEYYRVRKMSLWLLCFSFFVFFVCSYFCKTRSILFFLPYLFFLSNKYSKYLCLCFIVIIIGVISTYWQEVIDIFRLQEDASFFTRLEIYTYIFERIKQGYFILPNGFNACNEVSIKYTGAEGFTPHNDFLRYYFDWGIILIFFLIYFVRKCYAIYKFSSLKKGIICIFIFLSSNALHNTLFIPYVWLPIFFILILLKQKESR